MMVKGEEHYLARRFLCRRFLCRDGRSAAARGGRRGSFGIGTTTGRVRIRRGQNGFLCLFRERQYTRTIATKISTTAIKPKLMLNPKLKLIAKLKVMGKNRWGVEYSTPS